MPVHMLSFFIKRKGLIVTAFQIAAFGVAAAAVYGAFAIIQDIPGNFVFLVMGRLMGQISLAIFAASLVPGILRRFSIRWEPAAVIMLFRRQIGVLMFVFALAHYLFVGLAPAIVIGGPPAVIPLFQVFGLLAFFLTVPLAMTSNNFFQRRMGVWWAKLHRLTYAIAWLLFGHVALFAGVSVWSVLIGAAAVLEAVSWIYYAFTQKRAGEQARKRAGEHDGGALKLN